MGGTYFCDLSYESPKEKPPLLGVEQNRKIYGWGMEQRPVMGMDWGQARDPSWGWMGMGQRPVMGMDGCMGMDS